MMGELTNMHVLARYYGFVSSVTKKLSEHLELSEGTTVAQLIDRLEVKYGYKFRQVCFIRPLYSERDFLNILVNTKDLNNKRYYPMGLDTILNEGDVISFGPISGAA